ncbi:glycosyltransferase [Frondihabitans cladoniiphilus]|uniref:glycosyltransferase n=1 Tax=Frondihabitans cladoniiphilus TaxID=715785 RepID=UPI0031E873A0
MTARSGVYRSCVDLVASARSRGLDWTGEIAVRPGAAGASVEAEGVRETQLSEHGRAVVPAIRGLLRASPAVRGADVVITLISQSDMAMASCRDLAAKHVAWVRGLPWPDRGEQTFPRRLLLRRLEARALRRADDVWATSSILARSVAEVRLPCLVPAGVPSRPRLSTGESAEGPIVWAGRLTADKGVSEFLELARTIDHPARLQGAGPLDGLVRRTAPSSLEIAGWGAPDSLWHDAAVYVSTSRREAYGRCAVEAAQAGVPLVLSDQVGVGPQLITDPDLRRRFLLPLARPHLWGTAIEGLLSDRRLRRRLSDHVVANASSLSIHGSVDLALERLHQSAERVLS